MLQTLNVIQMVLGVGLLYGGAEWLLRGSARLARGFGVKPLVIGLTIVAYGASAPELAVATRTTLAHAAPIALGTVVGSCAANISLILGITALVSPPTIDGRILRREIPILLGSAIAVPLLLRDGVLSRLEGALLVGCAVLFTIVTLTVAATDDGVDPDAPLAGPRAGEADALRRREERRVRRLGGLRPAGSLLVAFLQTACALVLLVAGSNLFLRGGRQLAASVGMSERMLGLTVISLGTALPELVAAVVAASRGHAALAVGSVIGSNLLNVFLVLGVTAYLRPIELGERMHVVELVGLVAITLLGALFLRASRRISRVEGAILVAAYAAFVAACAIW